jgi:hypothetical protein
LIKIQRITDMCRHVIPSILEIQDNRGNTASPAILVIASSWTVPDDVLDNPNLAPGDPNRVDFGAVILQLLNPAGVIVMAAAGNTAGSGSNALERTPQKHGGDTTSMIVVGATDELGQRASFSEFRDNGQGIVSVYCIGTDILIPFITTKSTRRYIFQDGTSLAAPLAAGVLSSLISRDGTVTTANAKARLQQLGQQKKGVGWPIDAGAPAVVPRLATDNEPSCLLAEGQQPAPLFTATWVSWAGRPSNVAFAWGAAAQQALPDYLNNVGVAAGQTNAQGCVSRTAGVTIAPMQTPVPNSGSGSD